MHECSNKQGTHLAMSKRDEKRILGLSPRARRVVVPFLAAAAILIVVSFLATRGSGQPSSARPVVRGQSYAAGYAGSPGPTAGGAPVIVAAP